MAAIMQPEFLEMVPGNESLRRALGGRLRTYRPDARSRVGRTEHLDHIRKALLRGELVVNGFNRWRLLESRVPAIHWTFADAGKTEAAVADERAIAEREAGAISIAHADESSAEETAIRIDAGIELPELLYAQRDWNRSPGDCPQFLRMIRLAVRRGTVVHVVAAFGPRAHPSDRLFLEARRQWRLQRDPLLGPVPRTSRIERHFGRCLRDAGLDPIPQVPVANYYLDFAVFGTSKGLPVRLDVEVDGRFWHEDIPGRQRFRDQQRDRVMKRLGWRPVRLWTDDIERDNDGCIERIRAEAASPTPLNVGTGDGRKKNDRI